MNAVAHPHVPVLIGALIAACAPIRGHWIDGTLGAGGYARALLEAGAERVTGIDRDPLAHDLASGWGAPYGERLRTVRADFSELDAQGPADGVCLDLGVSSMQLDRAERGFSFLRDGPLDMRMSGEGPSAADLVNGAPEAVLADVLHRYGEERAARRIARAILRGRPVETTGRLAEIVAGCLPRPKPGQVHPATRSFQAIRIAVNDELGELARGLEAAERALSPGGRLAVVTFHSIEDRIVKRFLQARSGSAGGPNRHAPDLAVPAPAFRLLSRAAADALGGRRQPARALGPAARRGPHRGAGHAGGPRRARPAAGGGALMRPLLSAVLAVPVIALASWAYREDHATRTALREAAGLERTIAARREALAVLDAEWAYLNRPERLRDLARLNDARLGLVPLAAEQFGRLEQVPYPPPPASQSPEALAAAAAGREWP